MPRYEDTTKELPRHMRYEYRIAQLLENEDLGVKTNAVFDAEKEEKEVLSLLDVTEKRELSQVQSPFIKACLTGQENNVQWMLNVNPSHVEETDENGLTAMDLLRQLPKRSAQHKRIMQLIEQIHI